MKTPRGNAAKPRPERAGREAGARGSRKAAQTTALVLAVLLAAGLAGWWLMRPDGSVPAVSETAPAPGSEAVPMPAEPAPERLVPRVIAAYPHDPQAYTQGLLWHEGALYESAGQYGRSSLRRVDLATGKVLERVDLPPEIFAEGLALTGQGADERLIQLSWQEGIAFLWSREGFRKLGERRYTGEGWGLCSDGRRLLMSDGSDRLTVRDPETFAATGEIRVTRAQVPVDQLNELECVGDSVWANVYQTDNIVRIDAATGHVTAVLDASRLLSPEERARAEVLNGIAYVPSTGHYLLTGKYWPKLFEVELAQAP